MKRIVSLVLALSMVLSMFTFSFAGSVLPDVEGTDYEAAVSALVELGIVNGYEDGTYKADRAVSRAEMAKFLVVSSGLEPAADVAKGATSFSDVASDHWATGYINVATEYGYINGYPDGTFAPDATVSYAEAVTMAIRVLGYKSVVESKGTWPTNYIAKAQELKVLEDVKYNKYTDGATRGNVALLIWNMLTTEVWGVIGENETDGLSFGKTEEDMIDKYFDEYLYVDEKYENIVTDISVADGKVSIRLNEDREYIEIAEGISFLDLTGRTVSFLYNTDEEKIVMLTASNDDKVVADYRDELSGDKYILPAISGEKMWGSESESGDTDYTVAVLGTRKNVQYATRYSLKDSILVDELKTKNDKVKVNGSELTLDEDVIVLIDGEWATADDVEIGDVITELEAGELYVVSRDVVTGTFEAVTDEEAADETRYFVTVDGDEYSVVNGIDEVVEIDEDDEETATKLALILDAEEDEANGKFYGEEATLYLNFLGEVVRIEFGEVEENEDAGQFYVLTSVRPSWEVSDKKGVTTYVELNGESYEVKDNVVAPIPLSGDNVSGDIVFVEFDSKDRVEKIYRLPAAVDFVSGDYTFDVAFGEDILDDYNYISGDLAKYKVNSATVVVKITPVEDDEDNVEYFEVETFKGASELQGVEYAVIAIDVEADFKEAAYVFVWEDAKNTEKTAGIVEKYTKSNGIEYLTIDGTKYAIEEITDESFGHSTISGDVKKYVGRAVQFIENEDGINVTMSYGVEEIAAAPIVGDVKDGRIFKFSGDTSTEYDLDAMAEVLEDVKVFIINVVDGDNGYEFDSYEEVDIADVKVKKEDRIAMDPKDAATLKDADTIIVIRGYEA